MPCVPILGRLKTAAIFQLDECMRPIYDTMGGYVDDCFAAFSTSDNMDEGTSFTRRCADGTILYHEDGEQSLQSVTVNLDLNAEPDDEWMALVGLVQPVENDGEVIGWTRCTKASANLLVAVWQEVLGLEACEGATTDGAWRLHLFPLKNARVTFEGNIGAEDGYVRITGNTVGEANIGQGPIPFLQGDPDPVFPDTSLAVCHHTLLTNDVAAPPEECGVIETEPPPPPPAWEAETAYDLGDLVSLTGGEVLEVTEAGTSDTTEPAAPGVGNTVVDGTVTWQQIS